MPTHLTVRMAWHDNKWNGTVCKDPAGNSYCVGTHSLLSERLARNKKVDLETPGARLDARPDYLPPCFWTSNAFGDESIAVSHVLPFGNHQDKALNDMMLANSVFSWPFRLSFNHDKDKKRQHGNYPPDLVQRIEDFIGKFRPGESIVFYYLNYSNPVSADDAKYALVGCSVLSTAVRMPQEYAFSPNELARMRSTPKMKNFPPMNWAIQFNAEPAMSVRLPYQEYLDHLQTHPNDDRLLDEIKVLIKEPALIPSFKYVAETLDDDKCLYLLYKLKKSLSAVRDHGIVQADHEIEVVELLIERCWRTRGLYPSLYAAIDLLAELGEDREFGDGHAIVALVGQHATEQNMVVDMVFQMLTAGGPVPGYLSPHRKAIDAARLGAQDNAGLLPALRKLSLFNLTKLQIERILFPSNQDLHPFGGQRIRPEDIVENPYLLCEEYIPEPVDLDEPNPQDGPIGLFSIDIGMFPDTRYVERHSELQNLTASSPERLRALILEYLAGLETSGHCFASLEDVHNEILAHPLFYREQLNVNLEQLTNIRCKAHFDDRIDLVENENGTYLYLHEIRSAERLVRDILDKLLHSKGHRVPTDWIDTHLKGEAAHLSARVPGFDSARFIAERRRLTEGCLKNSFFVVTGKPGSGKTLALGKVIEALVSKGESVTLLAPTGKASLRAGEVTKFKKAQTIDRFIFEEGFGDCLDDLRALDKRAIAKNKPNIQNLIIDESSMVDLRRLAVLFGMLNIEGSGAVKRVILVGDENQLPPIGFGKPFHDLVEYLRSDKRRRDHLIRLETNCRQQFDPYVLQLADAFSGRNRYYTEILAELLRGGPVSPGLHVSFWKTREDLNESIQTRLRDVFADEGLPQTEVSKSFNVLMGLYENGHVKEFNPDNLKLDRFEIITPYNAGFFGTVGLNHFVRSEYKKGFWPDRKNVLAHSEKIIRTQNWYQWDRDARKKVLLLSNGSIGVVCDNKGGRNFYFPERDERIPSWMLDDDENLEPAYAITVHKSQGSEFKHTFVVVPQKKGLLFRELVYTAFTRSSHKVSLFVQQTNEPEGPLGIACSRSAILCRNSSLFQEPMEGKRMLEPESGVLVKSKVEYIIYRVLMGYREKGQIAFEYERPMELTSLSYPIKTDFWIKVGNCEYLWEHLGMLDLQDYSDNWKTRRLAYESDGLSDSLITTDDLYGLSDEFIHQLIGDLLSGSLGGIGDNTFSQHHYRLYPE